MRLDFKNLPLLEVQIQLVSLVPLDIPFDVVTRIREEVKDRLPNIIQHPAPAPISPNFPGVRIHLGPVMPAVSFSNPNGMAANVHSNVISVSWSKPPDGQNEYPRYAALQGVVEQIYGILLEHNAGTSSTTINLTYANFLKVKSTSYEQLLRYLLPEVLPSLAANSSFFHELNYAFRTEDGGDFRVQIAQVSMDGGATSGFLLATSGGVAISEHQSPLRALDDLHETMQQCFLSMLSQNAKEEWDLDVRTTV